jgi:uncharacterized tellurite resistance protein B-like protein
MSKYRVYKGFKKQKEKEVFDNISNLKKKNILSVAFMLTVMSSLDGKNQSNDDNPIWILLNENNISAEEFIEYRDTTFADPEEIEKIKNYVISDFSYEQKLDLFKYLVYTALLDEEIDDSEAALLSKMEELLEISPEEAAKVFDTILEEKSSIEKIDNNVNKQIELFTKEQKFAIFYTLIIIADSDGITDEENTTLQNIADDLNINIDDYNESNISGEDSVNLLKDLNKDQKEAICALITTTVSSDGVFSTEEENYVRDIIQEYKLPFDLLESLMLKYNRETNNKKEILLTETTKGDSVENEVIEQKSEFCTHCGSKQEENSFCTECGKKLKVDSSTSKSSDLNDIANENVQEKIDDDLINFHFKNLKGIHLKDIKSPKPTTGAPDDFFNQDVDGSWYFTVMNFSMLFKSFSKETFEIEFNKLLTANNFEIENKNSDKNRDFWIGENFNIEIPKTGSNLIIISNEKITHKTALDIRDTNITDLTYNFDWIDGFNIYDFEDFAKNQSDLSKATNVPLYFKLPDENEGSIIITVPTENIGKSIIDQVININGGNNSFRSAEQEEWTNLYNGYEFVIGYFPERDHVRINQLPPLNVESIDHELRMRMWEFDEAFFMDKYKMDESEVEMEYWYGVILNRCTGLGGKEFAKKQNKDPQQLMLEYIWGHAEEYTVNHSDKSFEDKKRICLMRILCFGYIYKTLFEYDKKLDEFIEKNKFNDEDYKEDILFRLIHAKASVYGTIKFALASNISEDEIKEWFPSFEFDKKLIDGIDPMSNYR